MRFKIASDTRACLTDFWDKANLFGPTVQNDASKIGNGITIWLDCPFETVDRRVAKAAGDPVRPLARDPAQFRSLYDSRLEQYGLADVRIPITTDDPEETAAAILAHPIFR